MNYQDLTGTWDLVETYQGESTERLQIEIKDSGELVVKSNGNPLNGVYEVNANGDQMSMAVTNYDAFNQSVTTYLGDLYLGKVFGRMKMVNNGNSSIKKGTWGAAKV